MTRACHRGLTCSCLGAAADGQATMVAAMAELDYAFLADFAKVEPNGTLTTVGASFTFVTTRQLPAAHRMAVAGRVRGLVGEEPIPFRIEIVGPDGSFRIGAESELTPGPTARPYGEGFLGHLFALDLAIPLPQVGLYVVNVSVSGEHARTLAFDVVLNDE